MRKGLLLLFVLFFTGCGAEQNGSVGTEAGVIGADLPISREMAAKTIALAFYSPTELRELETELPFSDVSEEDWSYPYICGCVEKAFFAGSEEGDFRPQDALTLWEAQMLIDRISPDHESRMVLTEENRNRAISYELWMQLLEMGLKSRRGEDSLYSYGIHSENAVLLSAEGLCDTGRFSAEGIDLTPFLYTRITFLEKEGEILALLTVEACSPMIRNVYCRKEGGRLQVETGAGRAELSCSRKIEEGIYDVKLDGGTVSEVTPARSLGLCTVKRVNEEEILLAEKGRLQWAEDARIYDQKKGATAGKATGLICGTATAEYYEKDGEVCAAVIREEAVPKNMRVLLKGTEQKQVTLSAETGMVLWNDRAEKKFSADTEVILTADLQWFDCGILTAEAETPISVTFADGTCCQYEGILEMERRGEDTFSVINEVPLERYLSGVVPHEMPVSFGQEALKAQAIAARSFAYNQFYGNAYCGYGAHVVDTTASQVYRGYEENETAEAAVKATEGLCAVTTEGAVAQTYFYSTSCGFGAGSEEVWSADGTFGGRGKSYLQPQKYGTFETPKTEAEWLSFWQDWEQADYDADSPWHRWKVYFGCSQLTEILQNTLPLSANCTIEGELSEMGKLKGIEVIRRGAGGIVMELELTFEKGKVVVKTENAVRKALSPTKRSIGEDIYLQRKGGDSLIGHTMLPSGFFAVKEMKNEAGELTGIALYGGGNGHGVGMSQYGAKGLAAEGKTAEEILSYYFPGTTVEQVL